MNGYANMNRASQNEIILCDRLKAKFANRGASAVARNNTPTSDLVKKIYDSANPFETAERPAVKRTASQAKRMDAAAQRIGASVRQNATHMVDAKASGVASAIALDGSYARAYARAENIRRKAALICSDREKINALAGRARVAPERAKASGHAAVANTGAIRRQTAEVKTKASPFPLEIVVLLGICTVALMLVIYTISQIYSFSSDIARLKDQQHELAKTESSLKLELGERDDIRVIQQIAVDKIGMVKNESVAKSHVALTSNDRIDIAEDNGNISEGFFSTMLSAIGEKFSNLFN